MSDLSEEAFKPTAGKLGQLIYENPGEGVEPGLMFYLEVAFAPFELEGETVSPLLRVDQIRVEALSWCDLENSVHEFPWAPKPGSVEASMHLFGVQNPADVIRLSFGAIKDGVLAVNFEAGVDFELEADRDDLGQITMVFDLPLEVLPLRVSTSLEKRLGGDTGMITEAVSGFVRLSDYGPIEKAPGGFVFPAT